MTKQLRMIALTALAAVGLGLAAPTAAHAGSKGRRNTAIALGAVGIYGLVKKKPLIAGLGIGGAAYSYVSSRNARKKELERERRRRWRRPSRRVYYAPRRAYYGPRYTSYRSYRSYGHPGRGRALGRRW